MNYKAPMEGKWNYIISFQYYSSTERSIIYYTYRDMPIVQTSWTNSLNCQCLASLKTGLWPLCCLDSNWQSVSLASSRAQGYNSRHDRYHKWHCLPHSLFPFTIEYILVNAFLLWFTCFFRNSAWDSCLSNTMMMSMATLWNFSPTTMSSCVVISFAGSIRLICKYVLVFKEGIVEICYNRVGGYNPITCDSCYKCDSWYMWFLL